MQGSVLNSCTGGNIKLMEMEFSVANKILQYVSFSPSKDIAKLKISLNIIIHLLIEVLQIKLRTNFNPL